MPGTATDREPWPRPRDARYGHPVLRIGLTGGIGAGKSAVAARLARLGAILIDSDVLARVVVAPGTPGLAEVVEAFGPDVIGPDGGLDRPAMAGLVFADEAARARLNAIVHPLVRAETLRRMQQAEAAGVPVLVHDVPLLVELDMGASYHLVIVVDASVPVRLARLAEREGMDAEQARARMAAQASDAQRRAAADVWVSNDADLPALHATVDALWRDRLLPFAVNLAARRRAPRDGRAVIVGPDHDWQAQAARLVARVTRVAGDRAHRVDHIGSTSVPGLAAKDVIDLQVVVDDLETARAVAEDLADAGLVHMPEEYADPLPSGGQSLKRFAANADPGRAVNCHVRPAGSPGAVEALLFRDWLRAHPAEVEAYAAGKRDLAGGDDASVDEYAERKSVFIWPALDRARAWAEEVGWTP